MSYRVYQWVRNFDNYRNNRRAFELVQRVTHSYAKIARDLSTAMAICEKGKKGECSEGTTGGMRGLWIGKQKIDAVKPQWSHLLYSWITHARGFWLCSEYNSWHSSCLRIRPCWCHAPTIPTGTWYCTYLSSDNCIENWIKPSGSWESNGSCLSSGWVSVTATTSWAMTSRIE